MYGLLHVRVHLNHLVVQVVVVAHQDLWVPGHGHEDGVDAGAERCSEEVAYLQADKKRKGNNDHCEVPTRVVRRVGESKPQEGHQRSGKPDKHRTE